ncbi:MAG: hypothetical protein LBI14_05975 [Treponema sp.]|jgi:hypothetical protein|nr:hypothetical protein [Treponema sp.]
MNSIDTRKKTLLIVLLNTLVLIPIFAQAPVREDIWVCPVFETNWFSISKVAFGGGVALGYGDGVAFGLKVIYFDDLNEFKTVELNFLLRFYLFRETRAKAFNTEVGHQVALRSGLFLQLNGGPVIFAQDKNNMAIPSKTGTFSVGLCVGWRILLGRNFFLEPAVRVGYPYMVGAGLSAGIIF